MHRVAARLAIAIVLVGAQAVGSVASVGAAGPTASPPPATVPENPPARLFGKPGGTAPRVASPTIAEVASGFNDSIAIDGLTRPIAVRFASDGSVFVAEKSGIIKRFASLDDPSYDVVADLRSEVHDYWDRGLLGFTLDPNYPASPYAYVLYAFDAPIGGSAPTYGDICPKPPGGNTDGCVVSGRLSRLTISGTSSTEQVLVNDWCQQFPSHSVGDLHFGADGALYASGGEGASFDNVDFGQFGGTGTAVPPTPSTPANPCGDPPAGSGGVESPPSAEGGALRAQSLRRPSGEPVLLSGSVIRVDPSTGNAAPDNPGIGDASANAQRIVGYGLRNPFRFTIRPGTNELWVGNVGWNDWESIDRIADPLASTVSNFGWPCFEGPDPQPSYQATGLSSCESLSQSDVTAPYFTYNHHDPVVPGESCPVVNGSSISGLAFYAGGSYPSGYDGALFFADHTRNCIWAMFPGSNGLPDPNHIQTFVEGAANPVDLEIGPGGDLFYVDHEGGAVHRMTAGGAAPIARIAATPSAGPTPLTISFDGTGSSVPDAGTLSYSWDLDGDGTFGDSTSATPQKTYASPGPVTVGLQVTDSLTGLMGSTTKVVFPGSVPPSVTIDAPTASLTWAVGDTIAFQGHAADAGGHAIPASGLSWSVIIHHCPSSCHTHLVQTLNGVASGSFTAPDHEYPSYLELRLTATDSNGIQATKSVTLQPKTVALSFATSPMGLVLTVGTKPPTTTPFTVTVIKGSAVTVNASQAQTFRGVDYAYAGWSDGGVQNHTIVASTSDTLTANYVFDATYHSLGPTRLVDTRTGLGISSKLTSGVPRTFQVAGRGGVPAGAVAVTGNLTVTGETAGGYLTLGPVPTNHPTTSTINLPKGDTRANGVAVPLAASGTPGSLSIVYIAAGGATTQVIFDVTGYYD